MERGFGTEKFLLEPTEFHDSGHLRELFDVKEDEEITQIKVPPFNAVLSYAVPKDKREMLPLAYYIISDIPDISAHNMIIADIERETGLLCLAALEGERRLLLLNSFKIAGETDLLYYISLVARQVMFNPLITVIYSHTPLKEQETALLERYFQKIIVA